MLHSVRIRCSQFSPGILGKNLDKGEQVFVRIFFPLEYKEEINIELSLTNRKYGNQKHDMNI
jgi:hypothetical protein